MIDRSVLNVILCLGAAMFFGIWLHHMDAAVFLFLLLAALMRNKE